MASPEPRGRRTHVGRGIRRHVLVEKAAAQAAAVVLNQPKTTTGRYRGVIEQAVHFRLRAVEPGSVVPVLGLPAQAPTSEDGALSMEVVTLGESAVAMLLDSATEQPHPPHPAVAKALLEVADGMYVGDRYEAVTLQARGDGRPVRTVRIDRTVRSRLRAYVDSVPAAPSRSDALMGVLVEACVVIPTDARVVDQWAAMRARLISRLKGEGINDLWVAACCLVHDLPLVTNNLRDYQTIATDFPALRLVHPDL